MGIEKVLGTPRSLTALLGCTNVCITYTSLLTVDEIILKAGYTLTLEKKKPCYHLKSRQAKNLGQTSEIAAQERR